MGKRQGPGVVGACQHHNDQALRSPAESAGGEPDIQGGVLGVCSVDVVGELLIGERKYNTLVEEFIYKL
jgi:hypothetical protein